MGKGSLAVLLLIVLSALAVVIYITGVEAGGNNGGVRLGLSFGATVILICFVFFLALYLGRLRTRGLYVVT